MVGSSAGFLRRFVVNSIYVTCSGSSILFGAFGIFFIVAPLLVAPGLGLIGAAVGLPIIAISIACLRFVVPLLFLKSHSHRKYATSSLVAALLAASILWAAGLIVTFSTRGI